jgi:hypothetical protein
VPTNGNIRFTISLPNSFKGILDCAKDVIDLKHHKVVYSIPCSCGKHYIGEIGRSLHIILHKYYMDIRYNRVKRFGLVKHSHNNIRLICIENHKIISSMDHCGKRKFEALEIELNGNNINRDERFKIKEARRLVIQEIKNYEEYNTQE